VVLHSREIDALIDTGEDRAQLARLLHESARHVVPELGNSRIAQTHVADRPIPADGFPSVGAVPSVSGYYEAVSHSGITLGPVIGRRPHHRARASRRAGQRPGTVRDGGAV
jgi:glycine/D-amino acid oxidase-like deaminating enzyme